jgi:hypothetical protein
MNLAEAFAILAKTGCRLRVEAEGGIILDVPPGGQPVPTAVLQVLAAHRESLVAVLAPAKPSPGTGDQTTGNGTKPSSGRPSPYAAENLAITTGPPRSSIRESIDLKKLLRTDGAAEVNDAPTSKALPKKTDAETSMAQPVTNCWGAPIPTRAVAAAPATPPQLDPQTILAKARVKLLK